MNTGFKFERGWRANGSFSYNAPYLMLQGKTSAFIYMSFSGSKELIKDKLTFSAGVNNPFTKFRDYISYTAGPNFSQMYSAQNYSRSFHSSLNWRFGKLKDSIKKNKRNISNDDVKSGGNAGGGGSN